MKHILLLLIFISTLTAGAQHKISPAGRIALTRIERQQSTLLKSTPVGDIATPRVAAIVRLNNGTTTQELRNLGYDISADLGDMAIVRLPYNRVDSLAALPAVRSISLGHKQSHKMKYARQASNVDEAHQGILENGVTTPYDGTGVLISMMDGGLDPNHINFSGRIKRLWHFSGQDATPTLYTDATLSNFASDEPEDTHATHVAGIMAGGYKSPVYHRTQPTATGSSFGSLTTSANPYYGVAPGATLALSCGDLYDENIIQAIENAISYSKEQGMPLAVNLSLGSNGGPQDGSDDFSQSLERLGRDAIICVSAGNEGSDNIYIEKTFSQTETEVKTLLYFNSARTQANDGYIDIWADDDQPFTVTIANVNSSGTLSYSTSFLTSTYERTYTNGCSTSSSYGDVYYAGGIDPNNNRYNAYIYFDYSRPRSGRFSISVKGAPGQTVYMTFCGYSEFTNLYNGTYGTPLSGYTTGTTDNTINSMVCGKNVLSVGAYNTTTRWHSIGSTSVSDYYSYSESLGAITSFSSYGHDFFGRQLPQVCAPGSALISSFSTPYIEGNYGADYDETADDMVASVASGSKTYYWGPMQGTSMACPFVTGTVALWLQADPTLTFDDIIDVINNSSKSDSYTAAAPLKAGAGKIDATAGLKYLMQKAAIGEITNDPEKQILISVDPSSRLLDITAAGQTQLKITITDIQGRSLLNSSPSSCSASIPLSGFASGIYIVRVEAPTCSLTKKIIL